MGNEIIKHIYVIFRGGLSGNYLGYNIGTYITKRFVGTPEMVNQSTNEYLMGPVDWKYRVNCTHMNLLDRKHIKDTFFDTKKVKEELDIHRTYETYIEVEKDSQVIVIHNNWNISYTQIIAEIKQATPLSDWMSDTDERKKDLQDTFTIPYARMSANFKEEGYDVFDLEYKDIFIDKDRNKYIELCTWLGEDYSNEGYLHLAEYVDLNTALMKDFY